MKYKFSTFLLLVLAWQFLLAIAGACIEKYLGCPAIPSYTHPVPFSFLSHIDRFDSDYYKAILQGGYEWFPISRVFYPLYCLVIKSLLFVWGWGIGLYWTVFIVNTICTSIVVYFLQKIISIYSEKEPPLFAGFIIFCFPTAVYFHFFYTESLFCAIAFSAFYMALKERWLFCCILLAFATATRLPAILFIGLCGLQYLDSCHWKLKRIVRKEFLYFLITPLGFVAFALYLHHICGNYFAMFDSYKYGWDYQIFDPNIFKVYWDVFLKIIDNTANKANETAPFFLVIFCIISSVFLIKNRKGSVRTYPLGIFGICSIIMFSLNSNLVSITRYLLPCINIYIFIHFLIQKDGWYKKIAISFLVISCIFEFFFFKKFCMWLWIA